MYVPTAPTHMHQTEPTASQKTQYAMDAKRMAAGKLNAIEQSPSSPMPVGHFKDTTTKMVKQIKYRSWKKQMMCNMTKRIYTTL